MSATEATLPVSVTQVPGRSVPVLVNEGDTVADAIRAAGVSSEGMQIRVAGEQVSPERTVSAGDQVVLSRQIKGN